MSSRMERLMVPNAGVQKFFVRYCSSPLQRVAVTGLTCGLILTGCGGGGESAAPLVAGSLQIVRGATAQTAVAGAPVPVAPAVRVLSTTGEPMNSVLVSFSVVQGGGTVSSPTAQPNAAGEYSAASWVLGPTVGANRLQASVQGVPGVTPAVFEATSIPGAPARLDADPDLTDLAIGGNVQLSAVVRDPFDNLIASPPLTFENFAPTVVSVSASGLVTALASGEAVISVRSGGARQDVRIYIIGPTVLDMLTFFPRSSVFGRATTLGTDFAIFGGTFTDEVTRIDLRTYEFASPWAATTGGGDMAIAPSELVFYSLRNDARELRVINTSDRSLRAAIPLPSIPIRMLRSRDGTRLFVTTDSGQVVTVSAATNTVARIVDLSGSVSGIAVAPDDRTVYVSNTDGRLYRVPPEAPAESLLVLSGVPLGLGLSADATRLYVARVADHVAIVDLATRTVTGTVPGTYRSWVASPSPDGDQLWVVQPDSQRVTVFRQSDLTALRVIDTPWRPFHLAFDRIGARAIVTGIDGVLVTGPPPRP